MKKGWYKLIPEQIVNALTVAGIAALGLMAGTQSVSGKAVAIIFGLTFLSEFRKWFDMGRRR